MTKRRPTREKTWIVSNATTFAGYTTAVGGRRWVKYEGAWAYYIVLIPEGYEDKHARLVSCRVPRGMFFLSAEYRLVDKPWRVRWIDKHQESVRNTHGGRCPEGGTAPDGGAPPEFAPQPMCDLCASEILWETAATDFPGHWKYW